MLERARCCLAIHPSISLTGWRELAIWLVGWMGGRILVFVDQRGGWWGTERKAAVLCCAGVEVMEDFVHA